MLANRSMVLAAVMPELDYPDVTAATEWLVRAFGFRVRLRIANHRAHLEYGGAALAVREGLVGPPAGHGVMVRVEDVDAHYAHALAAGASVAGPPRAFPYGERQYNAVDLAGHRWTFSQSVADVDPADWGGEAFE